MPGQFVILNIITIIFQYTLLFLLYYFLYKVIKIIYLDLQQARQLICADNLATDNLINSARLFLLTNTNSLQTVYPLKDMVSIGRKNSNDIVVDENFVSSEHVCIEKYKGDYWLTDLNSTNGTYINECRVTKKMLLQTGDLIKIGAAVFRFER